MIGIVQLPVTPPTPIRTERLVLRPFRADDVEPLLAFHSDPEAVRYVPYPPRDRAQVAAVVELKRANTSLRPMAISSSSRWRSPRPAR